MRQAIRQTTARLNWPLPMIETAVFVLSIVWVLAA